MDIDADGYPDILSGSYSRTGATESMAGLFQVLYGKPNGTFREAEVLKGTDGKPLIIPSEGEIPIESICTRPFAVDWDGDGRLDLVVGNFAGHFYRFKGDGNGKFRPKPEIIKSGGSPLTIDGAHSDPFVIDWDGDGALDIVSGTADGGVKWAKNHAPKGKPPELGRFEWLVRSPSIVTGRSSETGELVGEKDLTGPTTATRVWVGDFNGDRKLDLLVGDSVTLTSPVKGLSLAEYKKKLAAWQKAVESVSRQQTTTSLLAAIKLADQAKVDRLNKKFQELYQQRGEFMNEDSTGFVWLYLQK